MLDSRIGGNNSNEASFCDRLEHKTVECWLKLARALKVEELALAVVVREEQKEHNAL